ncbi:MAG: alpha-N-arabinofuranosidase [Puniceicoccaceae bacterium 5H]|nr:MAG: alpha-N-arabinofuranosidase [Puniceicoccaceae bacterium 5H]
MQTMTTLLRGAIGTAALLTLPYVHGQSSPSMTDIQIDANTVEAHVHPEIYGHFAEHLGRCIYGGIWVGEDSDIPNTNGIRNDVVQALRDLDIPVLRWPGGCFADEYHWRDGIGPREERPAMINTHWGGVTENNHFGTHEFMELCEQLDTDAYVAGNLGSGTIQEMMNWVEYMTSDADSPMANLRRENGRDEPWDVQYFGVGNESWGCGGSMRPEYYADVYRRYNTFVKDYGDHIYRIACGANGDDLNWTDVMMDRAGRNMDGLSLHYYTLPTGNWGDKGPATGFGEDAWMSTLNNALRMDEILTNHSAVMDKYDPDKKVGLIVDEWGVWTNVEPGTNPGFLYQQNSLRDALVAALHFNIFHKHADRVRMANIAQTVNVLQAMLLTDGPKMVKTPTYWVFEMYKVHQDEDLLGLELDSPEYEHNGQSIPQVSATATRNPETGVIHVSLVNTSPEQATKIAAKLEGFEGKTVKNGRILTADAIDAHNTFDDPEHVQPKPFSAVTLEDHELALTLPAKSIVVLELHP